ncbi:MAG: hypothetical protein JSS72_12100 [Armatimonadetes bacterium]|nr:hypothetical protein [Armatimonadota bacterium]
MRNPIPSSIWFSGALTFALLAAVFACSTVLQRESLVPFLAMFTALAFALTLRLVSKDYIESRDQIRKGASQVEMMQIEMAQRQRTVDVLADGLDIAVFITDQRASVLYANQRAREMFRFDDPVGRSILAVTLSYDLEQAIVSTVRVGLPQEHEVSFGLPSERVGIAKCWPSYDNGRVFLTIYEVTDLRRLERVRQDFVSNVSHELRTPMTVIRTMTETLIDDGEDAKLRLRYLNRIIEEIDRLTNLTNDLLNLSVAESRKPPQKSTCNLAEVFRDVFQQLSNRAKEKGLEVRFAGPESLYIEANQDQMRQVAINLIDNAINYTQEGLVEVVVEKEGGSAVVHVIDSGIGIATEDLPRVFERFYRVDRARSRATGGTGLGLSIVKHVIESHGGTVSVESNLNQGSTFTVVLPASS